MRSLLFVRITCIFALLTALAGYAAEPATIAFDIPADTAAKSLKLFAQQSGSEVIIRSDKDGLVKTNAVKGSLPPAAALDAMLKDTGLVADRHAKTGAFAIRSETEVESKNGARAVVVTDARPEKVESKFETDANGEKILKLETFEVFGRKTLNMDIKRSENDALPYVVISEQSIRESGAINLDELIRTRVPMASVGFTNQQLQSVQVNGVGSSLDLRGLGANQTLVLVDGHRVAGVAVAGTPQQPDISGIPLSAVERVEVLPSSASGIYGGNATGGVINVILKRNYSGGSVGISYQNPTQTDAAATRLDINVGANSASGVWSMMINASYARENLLLNQDRDFARTARQLLNQNNPAAFRDLTSPPLGATTNISTVPTFSLVTFTFTKPNLSLKSSGASLGSPITFVPYGYAGGDSGAALVANAGSFNLDLAPTAAGGGKALRFAPTVKNAAASIRGHLSASVEAFSDFSWSESRMSSPVGVETSVIIPTTAAINPFREDIRVTTPLYGTDTTISADVKSMRAVVGAIVGLPRDWKAGVDLTYNETRYSAKQGATSSITSAGSQAIAQGVVDVLKDTARFPVDFSPYRDSSNDVVVSPVRSSLVDLVARAGGQFDVWSWQELTASGSLSYREEKFNDFFRQTALSKAVYPARNQTNESAYLELRAPFGSDHGMGRSEIQVSLRGDRYRTNGAAVETLPTTTDFRSANNRFSSLNPNFAAKWAPSNYITVRANYGTGFLPPSVSQLVPDLPFTNNYFFISDPKRGNEALGTVNVSSGGNPALKPERSESYSAGIIFAISNSPQVRVSVDWMKLTKTDEISSFSFLNADTLAMEDFVPGLISRASPAAGDSFPVGKVTGFNRSLLNFARGTRESVDYSILSRWENTNGGAITLSLTASQTLNSSQQATLGSPKQDYIGYAGRLRWRGIASLRWEKGPLALQAVANYYHRSWLNLAHTRDVNQNASDLASKTVWDVSGSYRVGKVQRIGFLSRSTITIGAKNLTNVQPNIIASTSSFGDAIVDSRLTSWYTKIDIDF